MIEFLPLRTPRTSSSSSSTTSVSQPSALLVVAEADGDVRLYTPTGEQVAEFSANHTTNVEHLAVSPNHDEHYIATADTGGAIRVHVVKVRPMRLTKQEK